MLAQRLEEVRMDVGDARSGLWRLYHFLPAKMQRGNEGKAINAMRVQLEGIAARLEHMVKSLNKYGGA